jgi:hypothetical protein
VGIFLQKTGLMRGKAGKGEGERGKRGKGIQTQNTDSDTARGSKSDTLTQESGERPSPEERTLSEDKFATPDKASQKQQYQNEDENMSSADSTPGSTEHAIARRASERAEKEAADIVRRIDFGQVRDGETATAAQNPEQQEQQQLALQHQRTQKRQQLLQQQLQQQQRLEALQLQQQQMQQKQEQQQQEQQRQQQQQAQQRQQQTAAAIVGTAMQQQQQQQQQQSLTQPQAPQPPSKEGGVHAATTETKGGNTTPTTLAKTKDTDRKRTKTNMQRRNREAVRTPIKTETTSKGLGSKRKNIPKTPTSK